MTETDYDSAVAVIGMSGRFPGAATVDELWDNLMAGRAGLRPLTEVELAAAGIAPATLADPNYVRVGAPVEDIDQFDASVFGFSRREAEAMEPQHRLFLECSWEALESAGYAPTGVPGKVGVFAGCGFPDYILHVEPRLSPEPGGTLLVAIGNERDSLASLLSYKLDLRGPSVTVQTFCSTSLVATHLAAQSLLNFECDVAVAGGAYLPLPQTGGYLFEEGGITTPDGAIRSFDAAANGTVLGNGVAVIALKRMTEALADGDPIHAVILGSAVNNDGRACAGYTAPGVDGQTEVMELALGVADVKPETIGYIECHATGTQLGDSIELAALSRAYPNPPATPCVLSTLKPSLGHLDRASGVAGLIRTAMALRNRVLPGTPNFDTPNPTLAAAADRFTVLTEPRPWAAGDHPRRAGVSSFGFGGTNAHVVLEEPPARPPAPPRPGPHLLVLSARDLTALYAAVERLRAHLDRHRDADLADVAYTLQQSRSSFMLRWSAVVHDYDDAVAALADPARWIIGEAQRTDAAVVVREPSAGAAPESWWTQLHSAFDRLAPAAFDRLAPAATDADPALPAHLAAAGAAAGALAALGVRVGTEADDAVELFLEPTEDEPADVWLRNALAVLWQAGVKIDWSALHHVQDGAGRPRRVPLPTYPFQRQRYWLDRPAVQQAPTAVTGKTTDPAGWTYLASWRRRHLQADGLGVRGVPDGAAAERLRAAGPWLVFTADDRGDALAARLRDAGADVTAVRPGEAFGPTGDGFAIRPDCREDHDALLAALVSAPRTVVHGFSLTGSDVDVEADTGTGTDRFDRAQSLGFYSVLALVGALDALAEQADLVLLTAGAAEVTAGDLRHPEHATLAGLAPVVAQENPGISCRHVDVDAGVPAGGPHRLAERVLAEAVSPHDGPVAWRGTTRWLRAYEPQPLTAPPVPASPIPPGSTVLITGGLGNIGLVLARHLAGTRGCRLVLTARSWLPPREEWSDWLANNGAVDTAGGKTATYLRRVLELERAGAEVLAVSADVADAGRMAEVVRAAEERFGAVDVVVHAAGVQDSAFFAPAHTLDRAACDAHFRAKVHGFLNLQRVLGERVRGPQITMSSLSALLGGITFGPYAASNAALDAYVLAARQQGAGSWVTVDWDAWRIPVGDTPHPGPVGDTPSPGPDGARADDAARSSVTSFELTAAEGVDVFERAAAVATDVGHLVISTGSLDARLAQWVIRSGAAADDGSERRRDPRPTMPTPYVEPGAGVEATLAEIWAAALGLEKVGADDDFYRLGGDSIVAIELIAKVRAKLKVSVPVTALLENGTVRQLAKRVAAAR